MGALYKQTNKQFIVAGKIIHSKPYRLQFFSHFSLDYLTQSTIKQQRSNLQFTGFQILALTYM